MLLSKVAIVVGGVLLLAYFLGAISFDPTILIGAIAAIVGGVVVLGLIRAQRSRPWLR